MTRANCRTTATRGLGILALALASLPLATAQAAPQQAGVSSAISGNVTRATTVEGDAGEAGGGTMSLQVGSKVFMQDRVSSAENSRAQILLMDESAFKLGPSSDVVIDEFVYDPDAGTGALVAEATVGTFRFVSGTLGKTSSDDIAIETPDAVMGVRGTIALVDIVRGADGDVQETWFVLSGPGIDNNANARRGAIQITAQGVTVTIQRTGWGTVVKPGQPPQAPRPVPSAALQRIDQALSAPMPQFELPGGEATEGTGATGTAGTTGGTGVTRASATDPSGGSIRRQGATRVAGQSTATTAAKAERERRARETSETVDTLASPEELRDEELVALADGAGLGDLAFLLNPLQTFEALNAIGAGTASASQTGVPLFDAAALETASTQLSSTDIQSSGDFLTLESLGIASVGSYDVSFQVDFGARTFRAAFDNIDVANLNIANGSLVQDTDLPASGPVFVALSATQEGVNGVTASGSCVSNDCTGIIAVYAGDTQPVGGIQHVLGLGPNGEIVGAGFAAAD